MFILALANKTFNTVSSTILIDKLGDYGLDE